jgi:cytochrome b
MEETEVPMEHLHETIEEKVEDAIKENEKGWSMYVAISTALIAVFAAISALLAGHHSDEAVIEQIKASDQWAYYQAKGIKAEIMAFAISEGKGDQSKIDKYKSEQADISENATEHENESALHAEKHKELSKAVTFFQIAIAISAIAILTRRKQLWYISLLLALGGIGFFIMGLL